MIDFREMRRDKSYEAWIKMPKFDDIYLTDEEYSYIDKNTGEITSVDSNEFCKLFAAYSLYIKAATPPLSFAPKEYIGIDSFVNLISNGRVTKKQREIIKAVKHKVYSTNVINDVDERFCMVNKNNLFKIPKRTYKVVYPFELFSILLCDASYNDKLNLIKIFLCLKSNIVLSVNKPDTEYVFVSIRSNTTLAAMCNIPINNFRKYMNILVQDLCLFRKYQFVNDETGMKHTLYCEYDNPNYKRDFKYAEEFILNGVNNKEKSNSKNINSFADIASNHSAIDNIPIPVRKCKVS